VRRGAGKQRRVAGRRRCDVVSGRLRRRSACRSEDARQAKTDCPECSLGRVVAFQFRVVPSVGKTRRSQRSRRLSLGRVLPSKRNTRPSVGSLFPTLRRAFRSERRLQTKQRRVPELKMERPRSPAWPRFGGHVQLVASRRSRGRRRRSAVLAAGARTTQRA
jgi:hypothetical protein